MNTDLILAGAGASLAVVSGLIEVFYNNRKEKQTTKRITEAESKVEQQPEKAKPAWDLARITLEAYFNRNLSQIRFIFWLSLIVMTAGFGVIIWGISQAVKSPDSELPAVMTSFAGVITEFIGATFLYIYRTTVQQAASYIKTLERINSVGMAMQILDTIPDDAKADNLKASIKSTVVTTLVQRSYEILSASETSIIPPGD